LDRPDAKSIRLGLKLVSKMGVRRSDELKERDVKSPVVSDQFRSNKLERNAQSNDCVKRMPRSGDEAKQGA
jgi:hypothetical protein